MKISFYFKWMLCSLFLCLVNLVMAQPPGFDNDTADVPIDGGLSILVAIGIGYGVKKNLQWTEAHKKNKPAPKNECRLDRHSIH